MTNLNIKIGADPELFVKQNGQYVSGFGLVPGDKVNPYAVEDGAVQVDGMALEFNINPAEDVDTFCFNIYSVIAQLQAMVPDYEVVADPVATFTPEYMKQQHPLALELGCDPDYNAWTGKVNDKPDCDLPIRTGAGHVHIGWREGAHARDELHVQACRMITKQLDFYLGLPSLLFDTDTQRRSMYGKAGAYRVKSYGVEYRVLSNTWLREEGLMRWVFENTHKAVNTVRNRPLYEEYGDIQGIINNSDVDAARAIIYKAGIDIPEGV